METTERYPDFAAVGPGTPAGRYLRRFWHPVYIGNELAPGTSVPLRIMGEDFTLYRGESGNAHIVDFRCAHRQTQLTTGTIEGDDLRCLYHGWKYDSSGQCLEQPAESPPFCQKVKIGAFPTVEYLGLIFGYFGRDEPPSLPRWPEFEREGTRGLSLIRFDCSYFQFLENVVDDVHLAFVHRTEPYLGASHLAQVAKIAAEETPFGLTQFATRPSDPVPRKVHFVMPNQAYLTTPPLAKSTKAPLELLISWVPVEDGVHNLVRILFVADKGDEIDAKLAKRLEKGSPPVNEVAAAILRGELRLADVQNRPDLLNIQDHVALAGQGAIMDRSKERLGRSDIGVILLRKMWARELRAVVAGTALTQFTRPAGHFSEI